MRLVPTSGSEPDHAGIKCLLSLVDRCVGMVIAPVEPVVLEGRETLQTFALRWAGDGATLEIPFAGCRTVD